VRPVAARPSPLADLLAHRPEAETAAVLEEVWALAGVQPVGGRSAGEIAHRLAVRAAEAESPALTPATADLVRRFLAVDDRPTAALESLAAIAREAGAEMDPVLQAALARFRAMDTAGVEGEQRFSAAFGRAFEYYDGFLFEVRSDALGPDRPVAAGGRYDRLPTRLGGRAAGAVGCMVRPGRAWAGSGS
jgi:ATP phosphoribosyltransferase regulatory subunit